MVGNMKSPYRNIPVVTAILFVFGAVLTTPLWELVVGKVKDNTMSDAKPSSDKRLFISLKDIFDDINGRPILQQEATAEFYVGMKVERERVYLLNAYNNVEDRTFSLTMTLHQKPNQLYVPKRTVSCTVSKADQPELNGAKCGLGFYISGRIKHAESLHIQLSDAKLDFS
ncbi:MAG: hypothetical protein WBC05_06945 [Sedimentisphaerales bacterium]